MAKAPKDKEIKPKKVLADVWDAMELQLQNAGGYSSQDIKAIIGNNANQWYRHEIANNVLVMV